MKNIRDTHAIYVILITFVLDYCDAILSCLL